MSLISSRARAPSADNITATVFPVLHLKSFDETALLKGREIMRIEAK